MRVLKIDYLFGGGRNRAGRKWRSKLTGCSETTQYCKLSFYGKSAKIGYIQCAK